MYPAAFPILPELPSYNYKSSQNPQVLSLGPFLNEIQRMACSLQSRFSAFDDEIASVVCRTTDSLAMTIIFLDGFY
jgi:hypothetical protein